MTDHVSRLNVRVVTPDDPAAQYPDREGRLRFVGTPLAKIIEQLGGGLVGEVRFPLPDGTLESFPIDLSHLSDADPANTFLIVSRESHPTDLPEYCSPPQD